MTLARFRLLLAALLPLLSFLPFPASSACSRSCEALALYIISSGDILYTTALYFGTNSTIIQSLSNISDVNSIQPGQLTRIPFSCGCIDGNLGHNFSYAANQGDTLETIASAKYGNLTEPAWIQAANPSVDFNNLQVSQPMLIPVNCSCGDPSVSKDYGFFGTYAAQPNDTLSSLSSEFNISQELLRSYNPSISFDPLQSYSILFIPSKNSSGEYPPYVESSPSPAGSTNRKMAIIVGAVVGGICVIVIALGLSIWACSTQRKKPLPLDDGSDMEMMNKVGTTVGTNSDYQFDSVSRKIEDFTDGHCIHFSYHELATITENFNISREIGKGGFATVYYGERKGQKLAIKRMEAKETKEFMNELRVLSTVHHANLLRLVGYCTEDYLFLVYEYIENGTLAQHLRSKTSELSWERRVQIGLDAARGIEYMHEHTRPTYIHRDLKPSNILLDVDYRAKVGDFGLTRLLNPDSGGMTNTLGRYGTFGYMSPEYAQYGQVSTKLDVYAFGVILLQLVSGKDALLGANTQLATLFEQILRETDAPEKIRSLIDPALGTNYPFSSVQKMIELAMRCTQTEPELRPQMRDVVMDLITLSRGD